MPWNLTDIPKQYAPITDEDVDKLDCYMALIEYKNQVEQSIIDIMSSEMLLDDEHPHAIVRKYNFRYDHEMAIMDLQATIELIKNYKF